MAVYNKNGTSVNAVYNENGSSLNQAYDIQGNPLIQRESNFVVMSYNVQWFEGINANQTMQEAIFSEYDADVIGFQEFNYEGSSGIPAIASTLLSNDYPYIDVGNYGNKNAIASKYAMSNFATVPHTTQTMDGQSYSTAHITVDNKDILLVVSHLTTSTYESTKVEQAHEIYEAVQNIDRFIVMADFNTVCKSINEPEYTSIMKQFVDAGYNVANCSAQFGFKDTWTSGSTESGTWYPCDHIITSANISMNSVVVDTSKIAIAETTGQSIDHLPIIAYLTI